MAVVAQKNVFTFKDKDEYHSVNVNGSEVAVFDRQLDTRMNSIQLPTCHLVLLRDFVTSSDVKIMGASLIAFGDIVSGGKLEIAINGRVINVGNSLKGAKGTLIFSELGIDNLRSNGTSTQGLANLFRDAILKQSGPLMEQALFRSIDAVSDRNRFNPLDITPDGSGFRYINLDYKA